MKKYNMAGIAIIVAGLIGFGGMIGFGTGKSLEARKVSQLEEKLLKSPKISANITFKKIVTFKKIGLGSNYSERGKILICEDEKDLRVCYKIISRNRIVEEHLYWDGKEVGDGIVLDEVIKYGSKFDRYKHGVTGEATFDSFFDSQIKQEQLQKGIHIIRYEVIDEKGNKAEDIAILKIK